MMSTWRLWRDRLLGRGTAACTVPVFDGPLLPNQALENAACVHQGQALWDMVSDGERLWLADGDALQSLNDQGLVQTCVQAPGRITALACFAGGVAYAVDGQHIGVHGGTHDGRWWSAPSGQGWHSINALTEHQGQLVFSEGSQAHAVSQWREDLMALGASGRVWQLDPQTGEAHCLADGLHHAFGVGSLNGQLWFSESWRHRVCRLDQDGPKRLLQDLPGYPSRLTPASGGGWWLTVFVCRTQLVEFVLREDTYRQRMVASMPPELWVAPQLRSGDSFLEPLQGGGIKQMGVRKPWAPPRSYGLLLRLDAQGHPIASLHSRGDGQHHGIVAACEWRGDLMVLSAGSARVLRVRQEDAHV